jgi:hypothetical protein
MPPVEPGEGAFLSGLAMGPHGRSMIQNVKGLSQRARGGAVPGLGDRRTEVPFGTDQQP